jgi:uncharacterized protein
MQDFKLSYYTIFTEVLDETAANKQRILYATRTGQAVILFEEQISLMKANDFSLLPTAVFENLVDLEAIVPADQNELEFLIQNNQEEIDDNKILSFTIQPSASCQLGCGYCGQRHTKDSIDSNVSDLILARIAEKIKTRAYEVLDVTWYGGEPLMALKQIRELSPRLIKLAEENGLRYTAMMVTNALSLKEDIFAELLYNLKINTFQITIDGLAEHHDKRRFVKEGQKPTFSIIFNNVLKITSREDFRDSGASISIRCNADKNNKEGILPFIHYLADHKLQDKIYFYVAPIHDWGDNGVLKSQGIPMDDLAIAEIDWFMELIKLNFKTNLIPLRKKIVCMVVDTGGEVFDAFGNVSKCYHVPYTPVYMGTDYVLGNLKEPEKIQRENIKMQNWNSEIPLGKTWCKTCRFLPVCGGGCPKSWLEEVPPCPTFKYNIADRLVLQYVTKSFPQPV